MEVNFEKNKRFYFPRKNLVLQKLPEPPQKCPQTMAVEQSLDNDHFLKIKKKKKKKYSATGYF